MAITPASTTELLFRAPPSLPDDDVDLDSSGGSERPARRGSPRSAGDAAQGGSSNLRMLRGARQAAAGMKISDAQIRSVLEDPQDVQPDPQQPHRTRLTRDGVTVTTGNDGMILRVTRKR
jgi:hypothetical protein